MKKKNAAKVTLSALMLTKTTGKKVPQNESVRAFGNMKFNSKKIKRKKKEGS
jgi:hypothetical protein